MEESNDDILFSLGIESSANKVGVGIVTSKGEILANEKMTYVGPPVSFSKMSCEWLLSLNSNC